MRTKSLYSSLSLILALTLLLALPFPVLQANQRLSMCRSWRSTIFMERWMRA